MRAHDFLTRVEEKFSSFLNQMTHQENLFAEKGEERIRIRQYKTKGEKGFPLRKVTFLILENGWVCNKDDKNILDEVEILVGSFIPTEEIPLPTFATEASLHFNKYDHLNVDLFPVSKNSEYQKVFCEPVKALRAKHEGLPGLLPGVKAPSLLGEYTSQGMMAGDFAESLRDQTIPWWFEYVDLYKDFLEKRDTFSILKDEAVIEEGKKVREMFLAGFRKSAPRILSDIPNLYTEEKGMELGELLF
jgi:hypothetical protein